jgi:hypothetical protein
MAIIDDALAKCDREAQRWADAHTGEVINLVELKAYRADIETRRQKNACSGSPDTVTWGTLGSGWTEPPNSVVSGYATQEFRHITHEEVHATDKSRSDDHRNVTCGKL